MNELTRQSEAYTQMFAKSEIEGASLFYLTVMWGRVNLFINGKIDFKVVNNRLEALWFQYMSTICRNPSGSGNWGVAFWEKGSAEGMNKGYHTNILIAVHEYKMKNCKGKDFLHWFRNNNEKFCGNHKEGWRDPLVRVHAKKWDGNQQLVQYCLKDHFGGLNESLWDGTLILSCKKEKNDDRHAVSSNSREIGRSASFG